MHHKSHFLVPESFISYSPLFRVSLIITNFSISEIKAKDRLASCTIFISSPSSEVLIKYESYEHLSEKGTERRLI